MEKSSWSTRFSFDPETKHVTVELENPELSKDLLSIGVAFEELGLKLQTLSHKSLLTWESQARLLKRIEIPIASEFQGKEHEKAKKEFAKAFAKTKPPFKVPSQTKRRSYYHCPYDGCTFKTKDSHGIGGHVAGHRRHGELLPEIETQAPKVIPASHLPRMERRSKKVEQNIREQMQWLIENHIPDKSLIIPKGKRMCPIPGCGEIVEARRGFGGHMAKHYREARDKPYLCRTCGKRFSSPSGLSNHVEKVHGIALEAGA